MLKKLPLTLTLSLFSSAVSAQSFQHDSVFVQKAISSSIKKYSDAIQGQTGLYNGFQYKEPLQTNDQHPFFLSDDWFFGSVHYNGDTYDNVPLLYDISSDKLVTEIYYNANPIVLIPERVKWFSFSDRKFQRIQKEDVNNSIPQTGYYEVLYEGTTKVIARRLKRMQERIESQTIQRDFEERNRYYVFLNNQYHSVNNKNSLLKLLSDEKQGLKQYMRNQKLRFKNNPDNVLAVLAKQYDTLKTSNE